MITSPRATPITAIHGWPPGHDHGEPDPALGLADLSVCARILRCLGAAFRASGQSRRAEPLDGAAEVLRELVDRLAAQGTRGAVTRVQPPHADAPRPRSSVTRRGDGPARDHLLANVPLTHRERDVLALVVAGRSDREIGEALCVSPRTATTHVGNILAKLGVGSRTAAAAVAVRQGLVD